jgi:hypothetical protein
MKQQRAVWVVAERTAEAGSWLLQGDPDAKAYSGNALPRLLSEGWRVVQTTGAGESSISGFLVIVEREGP